jgi:UDP-2-acetamido-2-deoxy-ribo-hexuluronate aminotransferase
MSESFIFSTETLLEAAKQTNDASAPAQALLQRARDGTLDGWTALPTVLALIDSLTQKKHTRQTATQTAHHLVSGLKLLPIPGTLVMETLATHTEHLEIDLLVQTARNTVRQPILVTRHPPADCPIPCQTPDVALQQVTGPGTAPASLPFIDLPHQQRLLFPQLEKNLFRVLSHGQYVMGPEIGELERQLAQYTGARHAISCSSGTDALLLGLMALDVGPGDAIFTTTFTFIATAEVIQLLGATPVFVDVDPDTYNIDIAHLEKTVEQVIRAGQLTPKGIIPVDLFGLPADYDAIRAIAKRHDLFILEDAAQSLGGRYKDRMVPTLGDVGATSFFPAKPLGGYGDGGAVFTNDDELAAKMVSIRIHGKGSDKYDNDRVGLNARLDTLQAAILLPKLAILDKEMAARQRVANRYSQGLQGVVQTPVVPDEYDCAWAQYTIQTGKRETVQAALKAQGIPTAVYYPKPLHRQTAFEHLGYRAGDFPVSDRLSQRVFSLPMHPYLADADIDRIVNIIRQAVDQ